MKKLLAVVAVVFSMCLMCSIACAAQGTAEDELGETASYVMNTMLAANTSADSYSANYDDVYRALLCIKAGVVNDDVLSAIDASVEAQCKDYDEATFLGATGDYHYAYNLAIAILYLEERGEDVTDYQGLNLLQMLETTYLKSEITVTAYGHQVVAGVVRNYPDYDWTAVVEKMKSDVLGYYSEADGQCGMDYWGISADNAGMIFPALYGITDDETEEKIDKSMSTIIAGVDETNAVLSWGAPSVDSTGLALKFAATFGYKDEADAFFAALAQFEDANIPGAYESWGSYDYSTTDVLYGLSQYVASQSDKYYLDLANVPEESEDPEEPEETPDDTPEGTDTPVATKDTANHNDATTGNTQGSEPGTGDGTNVIMLAFIALLAAGGAIYAKKEA